MAKKGSKTIIRSTFPQVYARPDSKTGNMAYHVSARQKKWGLNERKAFSDKDDALNYAREIEKLIQKNGKQPELAKDLTSKVDAYDDLVALLSPYNKTPEDAAQHYIKHLGQQVIDNAIPTVRQLVDRWKDHRLSIPKLSPSSVSETKVHHKFIKSRFGGFRVNNVRKSNIEETLNNMLGENGTRNKYATFIRMFFKYVLELDKGYIATNPALGIKFKMQKFAKEFYPVAAIKKFLIKVHADEPRMTLYYALCAFGGLRPDSEAQYIQWKHYNRTTHDLDVSQHVIGKTGHRIFKVADNLHEWITWYKKVMPKGTPLVPDPKTVTYLKNKKCKQYMRDIHGKFIPDGFRHGFATYLNSSIHNVNKVAHDMGTDSKTIKKHYMRSIPTNECDAYWAMTPQNSIEAKNK